MLTKFYDCMPHYGGNKHTSDIHTEEQQISGLFFRLMFIKEPDVSKIETVSILRWGEGRHQMIWVRKKDPLWIFAQVPSPSFNRRRKKIQMPKRRVCHRILEVGRSPETKQRSMQYTIIGTLQKWLLIFILLMSIGTWILIIVLPVTYHGYWRMGAVRTVITK